MVTRTPTVLVADTAPDCLALEELTRLTDAGFAPTVNLHRVASAELRRLIAATWPVVDFDHLNARSVHRVLVTESPGFDALKCRGAVPVSRAILAAATHGNRPVPLRIVARAASGTDNIDLAAASEYGVQVVHTPGANAPAVAEFTIALVIDRLRGLSSRATSLIASGWREATSGLPVRGIPDVMIGLVGAGPIAREVARLAVTFGARVQVHGTSRFTDDDASAWQVTRVRELSQLAASSDVVSIHVPGRPANRHLIDATFLALMRPESILINTSRGAVVDESAVELALREPDAPLGSYAADVLETEGPGAASPLLATPRALITPHMAGMTISAMRRSMEMLALELARIRDQLAG